jgi:hypothetical protein
MMDFLRAIPQAAPLIADLIAKNQDWEGAEEIAARLAKTLPPGMNQPEMRDVAPQVQALIFQLKQQVQQLSQEKQQLMAAVNERNQDRELARERINRNFEAQLLGIVQKAHAAAQKVQADDRQRESEEIRELASNVLDLYGTFTKNAQQQGGEQRGGSVLAVPSPSSFPGARQALDGHFYAPDARRPGKFLRVEAAHSA